MYLFMSGPMSLIAFLEILVMYFSNYLPELVHHGMVCMLCCITGLLVMQVLSI